MISTVSIYDFRNWFMSSDTYKNNFSSEGLDALFEYLEEYEESTGTTVEFDPVALCVEYTEYSDVIEAGHEYFDCPSEPEGTLEENEKLCREYLQDRTTLIEFDGGVIIQDS